MKLPDSIEALTEERKADIFTIKPVEASVDIDNIIYYIKQKIQPEYAKFFDTGLVCMKQVHTDGAMIRGMLNAYRDVLIQGIKKTTIEDEVKATIINDYTNLFSSIITLLESQAEMSSVLNKQKKLLT